MAIKQEPEEPLDIQLTSLIDCVFLLLIFFLVSSQMKKIEKELPIELPKANATHEVKAAPDLVTVSVLAPRTADLSEPVFYVNGVPVGSEGLRASLRKAAEEKPGRRIRINGDINAPFRLIVQVLDTCQGEGLTVVGINTALGLDTLRNQQK
jgi:biopolymer transport protein ExbD